MNTICLLKPWSFLSWCAKAFKIKMMFPVLLIVTIASVNAGLLHGSLFTPTTNIVSSRTIVGGAVGGGPTAGAISTAQYSQTVATPATIHTIITSHPGPNFGYSGGNTGGRGGGNTASATPNNVGAYSNYGYNNGHDGSNAQEGGYSRHEGSSGNGQHLGYSPSYYNQRY